MRCPSSGSRPARQDGWRRPSCDSGHRVHGLRGLDGYPAPMRRIERLINLVAALLETSRPMTADDIRNDIAGYAEAASFEAFRRMFERDKEALRAIGIPVE